MSIIIKLSALLIAVYVLYPLVGSCMHVIAAINHALPN